jgi:hypothetical protein
MLGLIYFSYMPILPFFVNYISAIKYRSETWAQTALQDLSIKQKKNAILFFDQAFK